MTTCGACSLWYNGPPGLPKYDEQGRFVDSGANIGLCSGLVPAPADVFTERTASCPDETKRIEQLRQQVFRSYLQRRPDESSDEWSARYVALMMLEYDRKNPRTRRTTQKRSDTASVVFLVLVYVIFCAFIIGVSIAGK